VIQHSVRRHLRLEVDEYDATIRRFIPGYETMLFIAAGAVAAVRPDLVIDLGAGTGGLSAALLERDEVGTVRLLDVDAEMLDQARARLERFGDRVHFVLRSYDESFAPCDAFAASLSLHHLPTLEAKSFMFERVFTALRPGGVFVNADVNMPQDDGERDRMFGYWAHHLVANGIPESKAWDHFEEWAEEDTYLPLEHELDALARVGFDAECVWQSGPIGVVVGKKPDRP